MMPAEAVEPAQSDIHRYLRLLGGRTCLDFVNTIEPRAGKHPRDFLLRYDDLVTWAEFAGIVSLAGGGHLRALSAQHPQQAGKVFAKNIALRELLYRLFGAVAAGEQLKAADLRALQSTYIDALRRAELHLDGAGFVWHWPEDADSLERIGWLLTQSATELLTSPLIDRVKMCSRPDGCGWLFLDTSKNGSRRWCSMEVCGSRAKMRRLYARRRQATRV
jgi:predicted RNA-binding Zn ribbon-like protein